MYIAFVNHIGYNYLVAAGWRSSISGGSKWALAVVISRGLSAKLGETFLLF